MKNLVEHFPHQLEEAIQIAEKAILSPKQDIRNVLITGLGGSGISGTILNELVSGECPVPITINKDYFLPDFVNSHSLVIISSYSGNTEETISAMKQALQKGAQIVCVTSGGQIHDIAKQHQLDCILIPGGNPPRSCIGYSLVQLLKIFQFNQLVKTDFLKLISSAIQLLNQKHELIKTEAMEVAKKLFHKIPVIYSLGIEGISVRFRQQINENSKMLCWHHVFPEMNHNELVGWTTKNETLAVVTFRTSFDYERTVKRYEVCKPLFEQYASGVTEIFAKGESKLEQFLYLIHIGDWISCYLADLKNIDAVEVNVITNLKNELAKFSEK